ncbi:hypothetical protein N8T08_010526 [Aspergillus melleus]|uniref:Uncharacterized protein n=1 Tax=Aspergillus melleus TaxID=138277 RepID=A0ACC3ARU6_9EURO|nr:hypothetical protein N8T08_010526 [Aspergillus melleus]
MCPGSAYCCCGAISYNETKRWCSYDREFTWALGKAIVGRAALKGLGVTGPEDIKVNRINTSHIPDEYQVKNTSSKETAIGAGVDVSLGVIALASLASLAWTFWLLRQNRNLKKSKTGNPEQGTAQFQGQMGYGDQIVTLWS